MPIPSRLLRPSPYGLLTLRTSTSVDTDALDLNWRSPSGYHYSLGLQSRLPGGAIFNVAYTGARDLHMVFDPSINTAPLASPTNPIRGQTTNTVANVDMRKPYPGWATSSAYNDATAIQAWYSALEASLSQQWRHRLQYQASFTWARLLTPVPGITWGTNDTGPLGDQNATHAHDSGYGPDLNIRPLRFVLSGLYNLPGPAKSSACWQTLSVGGVLQPLLWSRPARSQPLPTTTPTTLTAIPPIGRATLRAATRTMYRLRDRSVQSEQLHQQQLASRPRQRDR